MVPRIVASLLLGALLFAASTARAHFLWVVTEADARSPVAKVYFSESATPDDPDLLDRVTKAEVWSVPGGRRDPQPLSLDKDGDALVAKLASDQRHAPVVLRHTYGAISRGGETFLLNYYAKAYATALPGTWRAIDDADLLPLEVVPTPGDSGLSLKVLWKGKPQPGATVTVEGPGIEKKLEGTTDERGTFACRLPEAGLYSIRAKHSEATSGEHEGKAYSSIRNYSTLALQYLPTQLKTAGHKFPDLPKGVTSFGGAIAANRLYVYGGHYGRAHHYSSAEQSGDFLQLDLRNPQQWATLPGGPKLTGLALVPYKDKLYRVGGFTAKNAENEKESLWSQSDFARFDPETNQWQTLPSLPAGRSSHDAAVVGDRLYVVGGWNIEGPEKTTWHTTAWSIDLASEPLAWKPLPEPPFHRRALALAAFNDKLYCIGGMQQQGGPTTATAIFDPARQEWSEGPALLGTAMDGFGSSAFACSGRLFATTMSGSVQQVSSAPDRWELVAQLNEPRFFHRLLPWQDDRLVIVGGASMTTGKTQTLELLPVPRLQAAAR